MGRKVATKKDARPRVAVMRCRCCGTSVTIPREDGRARMEVECFQQLHDKCGPIEALDVAGNVLATTYPGGAAS